MGNSVNLVFIHPKNGAKSVIWGQGKSDVHVRGGVSAQMVNMFPNGNTWISPKLALNRLKSVFFS